MPGKPFDPTLKDLVECGPDDWPIVAGLPAAPTHVIDADIATVSGAADKVLRVETQPPYLRHLDFISGHDAVDQPRLLHKRNLLLEDRHDLTVRTVAVVLRPEADSPPLNGIRQRTHDGETVPYMLFRYLVLRVWQTPPSMFLGGGLGTLALAPISAVTKAELPVIIRQMELRLRKLKQRRNAEKLWAATYILMGLRYSADLAQELLRGVVSMEESTTYQAILREGMEKGLAEGRTVGRAEGALAEAKKLVLVHGTTRFGVPDESTRTTLESMRNLQRLEKLFLRISEASDWQELLRQPAPRRRNGTRHATT